MAAFFVLGACASATRQRRPDPIEPQPSIQTALATVEEVRDAIQRVFARLQAGGAEAPEEAPLQAALAAPAFGDLTPKERHAALFTAGMLALHLNHAAQARALFGRATEIDHGTESDWLGALEAAWRLRDYDDAVRCLTVIARGAPRRLGELSDQRILRLANEATKLTGSIQRSLFQALFDAGWKPKDGVEPSWIWRELATLLVEQAEPERAREVAARVSDPHEIIAMRVDHRFEPLVQADPGRFDVDRAQAAETDRARAAVRQAPRSLKALINLTRSLRAGGGYREALKKAEEALRRVAADGAAYNDVDDWLASIMNERARTLKELGRWDEAVAQLRQASRLPENGGPNVSQTINLGLLYCDLDRPSDALAAIPDIKDVSPYGRVLLQQVRATAAVETGDAVALARALGYLRDHQVDEPDALVSMLLLANEGDEAARELVSRLNNPRRRSAALLSVQEFADPTATARMAQLRERWKALRARPDVQAAIARVGRVERFSIGP